jgi:hypothetical protein
VPIITKVLLVEMQLPDKYKEKFNISSEGPSSGVAGLGKLHKLLY